MHGRQDQDLADFPDVKHRFDTIAARPAVAPDMGRLEDKADQKAFDDELWENLFGARQTERG